MQVSENTGFHALAINPELLVFLILQSRVKEWQLISDQLCQGLPILGWFDLSLSRFIPIVN